MKTTAKEALSALLSHGAMTTSEVSEACEFSLRTARESMNFLHHAKLIHIGGWHQSRHGQMAAVWAFGAGEDADKPPRVERKPEVPARPRFNIRELAAYQADGFNPFGAAMWNVAQGERP